MITGGVAATARVVQISTSLVTVPLTLKYLGNERFGLWMTISSVLAMAAFADFGVGNGVLSAVAKAYGKDDVAAIRRAVSSGFAMLNTIALLLLLFFFLLYPWVSWPGFFRVYSPLARSEAGPTLAVFVVCFALNISMDVVQRVQLGLQQGYRYGMWQCAGSMMGFAGVLCGIWLKVSLPLLVAAVAGAPIVATAINCAHYFGFVRPDLRPGWGEVSRDALSQILRLGGLFFVLQVVVAISYSADNLIIARTLGAVNVPEYSIPQRMFALIAMLSGMFVAPLWPAYGEAISRGDMLWVRRTLRKSLLTVLSLGSVASFLLLIFSRQLIALWVGGRVHPSFVLLLGFAVWTVVNCCGDALGAFLNGATAIRVQVLIAAISGMACLSTKIVCVHHFGISSMPWATTTAFLAFGAIPYLLMIPSILKKVSKRTDEGLISSCKSALFS
jgi:O-antigen/teichoic acid export membrane protein